MNEKDLPSKEEYYCNCKLVTIYGDEYNTYVITHLQSRRKLYTCNYVSAYSIAKLLDLEYRVIDWYSD